MKKGLFLWLFVAISVMHSYAQTRTITGRVTDARDGSPLPGVNVLIKGTGKGTAAALDGTFKLPLPAGGTLEFSFVGYATQTVTPGNETTLNIALQSSNKSLNELVVTALGIKRDKRTLTYATQEVKGASLVDAKQNNLVNALSGKVAGVQITNSSGMPGSSARIVIRGITSLTGENQALMIIDGVPMDNTEAGNPDGALSAGGTVNRASDIDPNIIESINVLKGSAATALYGSAAAKGAVIITTKNGRGGAGNGKPTVSFSSSYSFENPILPKFQSKFAQGLSGKYVDGNNGQLGSGSWGPNMDTLKVNGVPVPKRDNVKDFFRTGHTSDNNVSVSGFTDNSNYLVSYSYLKTNGTMPNTDYSRHAVFLKYGTQLLKNLQLNTQVNFISSDNNRIPEGNSLAGPLWTIYSAPISWNPKPTTYEDGSQRVFRAARNNPYWLLDNVGLKDKTNRVLPVINLSYSPLPWLTITERIGADIYVNKTDYHENIGIIGSTSPDGRVYNRTREFRQFNNDLIIQARKDFGSWTTDLILGNNIMTNYNDNNYVQGVALSVPGLYTMANASNVSSTFNYYKNRKVGFYAQASVEYKRMLTLALTGRYDGTSVLSTDKQFYPYGSASAGFIFTEPLKMSDNAILNFGKIRVSYSKVGNDNVAPYSLTMPYTKQTIGNIAFPFNGQNGYQLTNTYAYPLRNESVNEFEVGLETKFFRNRASLDISYFDRKSTDLLTPGTPIAPGTGFNSASLNAGDMRNKGIEVVLGITPIKTKNLTWEIGLNYTRIKNEVLKLSEGLNYIFLAGFTNPGIYAFANQPYGVIMGTHFKRNDQGVMLLDDNGYPQLTSDIAPIGNAMPKWLGGITSTLTYKGLSFSFVLDHKHGGDVLNLDNHYLFFYGTPKVTENRGTNTVFKGIIESTGKENTLSVPLSENYYRNTFSSADETSVEDASFLKLRQVSLAYNFGSILKGTAFKSLVVNVTGTNFILHKNYTGSDPEVSLNGSGNGQGLANFMAPANHSIIIGLKASF
ncbi:MAG TPA: SusC/RagA family TonB-linked outer membrane protein [Chitinophaga sp.]|uniref:SusC/RagA family TonB-linked outer membrane protein n=1 Tax=Chitinophaga sp. TaxID=1869181 RepID=UPI002C209AF2|nr:SusC/RagA family TonB-linked outer membrane protein [Chitinophaga sp.]HVI46580.1 SusC/RagA family TonB-linked outer membrane protein [Chitinophaga sp.]